MKKQKISILLLVLFIAVLATVSIVFWQENQISREEVERLKAENEKLQEDYLTLDASLISLNDLNVHMSKELEMFRNPDNRIFFLGSEELFWENSRAILCWNPTEKSLFIAVENFPDLPKDSRWQLWSVSNNELLSLGPLPKGVNSNFIKMEVPVEKADHFIISLEKSGNMQVVNPSLPYLTGNP